MNRNPKLKRFSWNTCKICIAAYNSVQPSPRKNLLRRNLSKATKRCATWQHIFWISPGSFYQTKPYHQTALTKCSLMNLGSISRLSTDRYVMRKTILIRILRRPYHRDIDSSIQMDSNGVDDLSLCRLKASTKSSTCFYRFSGELPGPIKSGCLLKVIYLRISLNLRNPIPVFVP